MKKTLLAVALLTGFAGAAQAADSVTLYGLIDAGIGYEKVKFNGNSQSRVAGVQGVSSGSRFGLRGARKTWAMACAPCSTWKAASAR